MSCPHGNPIGGCDTCDEVDAAFEAGKRSALAEQPAQLPFGVGGGLVAIKTLLSRDPCVHANTAIQMIDAILAEQPAPVQQEPVECQYGKGGYACCEGGPCKADEQNNAPQPAQQEPVGEVVLFGGDYKEVSWAKGKLPSVGTKLYDRPQAQQEPVIGETNVELGFYSDDASNGQQRELVGKVEMGQLVGNRPHESTSNPDTEREIAVITGVDEHGPMLGWFKHWINYPVGTKLYTSPPAQRRPLTDEEIWDEVKAADLDWQTGWSLDEDASNRYITFARAIEAAHGIKGDA